MLGEEMEELAPGEEWLELFGARDEADEKTFCVSASSTACADPTDSAPGLFADDISIGDVCDCD